MPSTASEIASKARASAPEIDIPDVLREQLDRHHSNLSMLASSLLEAGLEEEDVERAVSIALRSYQAELVKTILSLKGEPYAL